MACFIEIRKSSARGTDSRIADVMRHLHTRQHLGRAVVVCDDPHGTLSAARKQWLKLSRSLQKQRAGTINADKILKYTHGITRMQRMRFSAKAPLEAPEYDVYFLHPDSLGMMPVDCWTVYEFQAVSDAVVARDAVQQLPGDALVVSYGHPEPWQTLGLQPKKVLESRVKKQWRQAVQFLGKYRIDIAKLQREDSDSIEAMDDALDTLLGGYADAFLHVAGDFQRALELARPLRLSKQLRASYDSLVLLAHRVQALTPGAFARQFLEVYDENDSFFFYDPARAQAHTGTETLAQAFVRHTRAGRHNLARALQHAKTSPPVLPGHTVRHIVDRTQ